MGPEDSFRTHPVPSHENKSCHVPQREKFTSSAPAPELHRCSDTQGLLEQCQSPGCKQMIQGHLRGCSLGTPATPGDSTDVWDTTGTGQCPSCSWPSLLTPPNRATEAENLTITEKRQSKPRARGSGVFDTCWEQLSSGLNPKGPGGCSGSPGASGHSLTPASLCLLSSKSHWLHNIPVLHGLDLPLCRTKQQQQKKSQLRAHPSTVNRS